MIQPKRVVLILPCCIGDVVMATATLQALRRGWPEAHIAWAVGGWSKQAVDHHPLLDAILDTGPAALPVKSPHGFVRFVSQLRSGHFDLAVSLVRSPLMSLAVRLSGIPQRAGLDSAGRGFGYNLRVPVNPHEIRHEAEIYLSVAGALGLDTSGCYANLPTDDHHRPTVGDKLRTCGVDPTNYIVINPAGGSNPGMVMDAKRWPPEHFADLATQLAAKLKTQIVMIGGPDDAVIAQATAMQMRQPPAIFTGTLSFAEIALLASRARLYIGNDTGLTHLAAAAGAPTVAIFGPSDPRRYAPFAPHVLTLWKPASVARTGVAGGTPKHWDWSEHGIGVDEAEQQILDYLADYPANKS